ncbi:hypothetical protein TPB0596_16060 [Tsukamurella pulmonis]|nr:hypothetical protein TPB0596_16060 [Tsukamurella pulmonis]
MTGALLVPHEDVADLLRVEERVVDREDAAARNTEDRVHADLLKRPDDRLGAGDALGGHDAGALEDAVRGVGGDVLLGGCGMRAGDPGAGLTGPGLLPWMGPSCRCAHDSTLLVL